MKRVYLLSWLLFALFYMPLDATLAQCNLNVTITAVPGAPFCTGETVTLTANVTGGTQPYTYAWETGDTTQNIQWVLSGNDHITVVVTDDNGCTDEFEIKLTAWLDLINIEWPPSVCEGEELELSVYIFPITPGAIINWSTGGTGLYEYITSSGTYSVTVTNPDDGCTLSDTAFVEVNYIPSPDPQISGPDSLCAGQSAVLSVSGGPYPLSIWSTGEWGQTTAVVGPGIYSILVADENSCYGYDTLEILPGGTLPILDGPAILCPGQSGIVEVTNATSYTGFNWSTGETTPIITVSGPGTYSVTVTAAGGCTSTGSVTVAPGSTNITITGTTTPVTSCTTPNGAVNITVIPSGTYEFDWSNGPTTEDLANVAAGSYTVTVTDNGGCTASSSFAVANNTTPPVPTATPTADTCGLENGSINLTVSPTGNYTYLWSNGATTEDLSDIAAGTYTVTTTSTTTGCTATASATVTNTTINLSVTGVVTQPSGGQNNGAIDLTVSPTGTYTYNWSNGATTEDVTGLGEGTYTVTVSAGGNCTATASFVLVAAGCTMTVSISVDAPNPGVVCVGDDITITANVTGGTAPYTYAWSNGITTQSFTVAAPYNQTLVLNVTDDDGCTALATIHVKVNVWYVDINYAASPTCEGDTLALIASTTAEIPGTTYTWSTGETGFMIFVTSSGTYSVSMTHPNVNCTAEATVTVTIGTAPAPNPQIAGPATICPGQSATLTVTGGPFSSYFWSDGSTDPTLTITDPGNYSVNVTNTEGCTGMDFIEVQASGTTPILNAPTPSAQAKAPPWRSPTPPSSLIFSGATAGWGPPSLSTRPTPTRSP
ncbi:MAG: hypothetical protein IPM82_06165 [Saprospiraceae bacterium]|nr:hypothetical protein [Saprospiraceae bacterium]